MSPAVLLGDAHHARHRPIDAGAGCEAAAVGLVAQRQATLGAVHVLAHLVHQRALAAAFAGEEDSHNTLAAMQRRHVARPGSG